MGYGPGWRPRLATYYGTVKREYQEVASPMVCPIPCHQEAVRYMAYTTTVSLPLFSCERTAPIPSLMASVSWTKVLVKSGKARIGACDSICFSFLKACAHWSGPMKLTSLLSQPMKWLGHSSEVLDKATVVITQTEELLNLLLVSWGRPAGNSLYLCRICRNTLLRHNVTKEDHLLLTKVHLLVFSLRPASLSQSKTTLRMFKCSGNDLPKMMTSSK